jgi:uncharacterized SAM-binding protein YcdF (DUF218 family)
MFKKKFFWYTTLFSFIFLVSVISIFLFANSIYLNLPNAINFDLNSKQDKFPLIVVLTGGKGRIKYALDLYQKGAGEKIFIVGLDKKASLETVLKDALSNNLSANELNKMIQNIEVDRESLNTIENAKVLKKFLEERKITRVLIITSIYHVKRVQYLFSKILPKNIELNFSWVEREPFDLFVWYKSLNGIWVTLTEYIKYLYARLIY